MDLEKALDDWMREHEAEILDLINEEQERFRAAHPDLEDELIYQQALHMANRRFIARAIGRVLSPLLGEPSPREADATGEEPGR